MRSFRLCIKRLIDIIGSMLCLVVFSPLMLVAALLIKITMPGPVLFIQERVGKDKKPFQILKFRTMKVDRQAEQVIDTSKDKERLTKTGNFLRRTKIDELPQLVNVLRGDMSFVGPRPTIKRQVDKYTAYELQRLNMRPGMTGLAQVSGGIHLPWKERIHLDVNYVNDYTLIKDMMILFKTLGVVIWGEKRFYCNK